MSRAQRPGWEGDRTEGGCLPKDLSRALRGRQVSGAFKDWQVVQFGWQTRRSSGWYELPRPLSILFVVES